MITEAKIDKRRATTSSGRFLMLLVRCVEVLQFTLHTSHFTLQTSDCLNRGIPLTGNSCVTDTVLHALSSDTNLSLPFRQAITFSSRVQHILDTFSAYVRLYCDNSNNQLPDHETVIDMWRNSIPDERTPYSGGLINSLDSLVQSKQKG
jgi:hypothetical protein